MVMNILECKIKIELICTIVKTKLRTNIEPTTEIRTMHWNIKRQVSLTKTFMLLKDARNRPIHVGLYSYHKLTGAYPWWLVVDVKKVRLRIFAVDEKYFH